MSAKLGLAYLSLLTVIACVIETNVSQDAQIEFRAAGVVRHEGALEMQTPTGEMLFVQPTPQS